MRPADNIEKLIKKLNFKAGAEMNDRILTDTLNAQAESKKSQRTHQTDLCDNENAQADYSHLCSRKRFVIV